MNSTELSGLFKEEFFLPDLIPSSKEEILEELVQPLVDAGRIKSKDLVLETLIKRETLGSTSIGKEVAIPHCRTLAASSVHIVAGISRKGVNFKAIDKKKVHLFFLIIAPPYEKSNLYLPILGKIVEMVHDAKIRKMLLKAKDFRSFIEIIQGG